MATKLERIARSSARLRGLIETLLDVSRIATGRFSIHPVETDLVALVVVVQTNDSVASLLGQVRPLGPMFSDLLIGPSGQAAVITFSDRVQLVQKFGGDPDNLKRVMESLQANGGKARSTMYWASAGLQRMCRSGKR